MEVERKVVKSIPIDGIHHFCAIPDFVTLTNSELPIVVQNGEIYECIEKFKDVEDAKVTGESDIECLVIIPTDQSECKVAIRKAASRIKTIGGASTYPERIKSVKSLFEYLSYDVKQHMESHRIETYN